MAGIIVRGFELQFYGCGLDQFLREMLVPVFSGIKERVVGGRRQIICGKYKKYSENRGSSNL